MATWTSGNLDTNNQYIKYTISITENSTSATDNTSNVTVSVNFFRTNTGYETYGTGKVYCTIDGTQYTSSVGLSQKITSSGIKLFTKTLNIKHNSDGSKTLTVSSRISLDLNGSNLTSSSQSYSHALTKLARNSTISSVTSSVSINGTNTSTVNITRASDSYTHTVKWTVGSHTHSATKVGTSTSYAIPASWIDALPNSTSGTAKVTVSTYNGSTKIGSDVSKNFTITVPASVVPTVSATTELVNNTVPSSWGIYVQGKSKCKITVSGSSPYGATIKSFAISGTNGKYSGSLSSAGSWTSPYITESGSVSFKVKATDTRNRTASTTKSITVYPYKNPSISTTKVFRCTSDGTASDTGTYISASILTSNYSDCNGKNTITQTVMYRESTSSAWSTATSVTTGTSVILGDDSISNSKSYVIRFTITDAFGSSTKDITVSTSGCLLNIRKAKDGLAIGKFAEQSGLDIKWDSTFRSDVNVKGLLNSTGLYFNTTGANISYGNSAITMSSGQGNTIKIGDANNGIVTTASNVTITVKPSTVNISSTNSGTLALSNFNVTGLKCSGLTSSAGLVLANTKYVRGVISDTETIDLIGASGSNCNVGYSGHVTVLRGSSVKLGSSSGTAVQSDRNLKKDFIELDEKYDKFFDSLKPLGYKYILGSSDRTHCGFIAQEVENSLNESGLTTKDFGGITIDDISNYERETTEDKDGIKMDIPKSDINYLLDNKIDKEYSLRYEEFIALAVDQIQKLKKRVDALEKDNEELRHKLTDKE